MIFDDLTEAEVQILKLLRMHLSLKLPELLRYMEKDQLNKELLHLEREGLVRARYSSMWKTRIYYPTGTGLLALKKG